MNYIQVYVAVSDRLIVIDESGIVIANLTTPVSITADLCINMSFSFSGPNPRDAPNLDQRRHDIKRSRLNLNGDGGMNPYPKNVLKN